MTDVCKGLVSVVTKDGVRVWTKPEHANVCQELEWNAPIPKRHCKPFKPDPRTREERAAALLEYRKTHPAAKPKENR